MFIFDFEENDDMYQETATVIKLAEAKPFVKWVGGKRQLMPFLLRGAPPEFNDYYEPFLGGGAFFYKLSALNKIKKAHLNDCNAELITAYRIIKQQPFELIQELSSGKYLNDEKTFYRIRAETPNNELESAARFIYLNKTAFNGLYRVNSKGEFNVPFGKYKNPAILDRENILATNEALQKDEITCLDFEQAVERADKNDFVYFDPPYQPLSKTANFTQYTEKDFIEKDQQRLFRCFKRLDKKNCLVMLSNSYTDFVRDLYGEFNQKIVMAPRAINCKAAGRGKIEELVITNYG